MISSGITNGMRFSNLERIVSSSDFGSKLFLLCTDVESSDNSSLSVKQRQQEKIITSGDRKTWCGICSYLSTLEAPSILEMAILTTGLSIRISSYFKPV